MGNRGGFEDPQVAVTRLLKRVSEGDSSASDELYPLIYNELRRLAAAQMSHERPDHTLQPTALVNEAYLKLVQIREIDWNGRGHFFAMAAKIMRRILISHARTRQAAKRGAAPIKIDLDEAPVFSTGPEPLLIALDEALERLQIESPRAYQLVELKFFAGLSFEEAAEALGVSSRTLKRDWEAAKLWLYRELRAGQE